VRDRINQAISSILNTHQPDKVIKPFVCLVCDVFIKPEDIQVITKKKLKEVKSLLTPSKTASGWNYVSESRGLNYKYTGYGSVSWMQKLLLSPRGSFYRGCTNTVGFIVCSSCKKSLDSNSLPIYAIANNMAFGSPPQCLAELSNAELAFLSPVRTYGYCFTYTGGRHMNLKGTLSYYKVKTSDIVRETAHFVVTGLNEHVVIVLSGQMTPEQRKQAKLHSSVCTEKIIAAVQWLCANNQMWMNVTLEQVTQQLQQRLPVVLDQSVYIDESIDNESRNTETVLQFSVYYPDGSINTLCGGQSTDSEFRNIIQEIKGNQFDIEMKTQIEKEAVSDYVHDNLAGACLLQFPYGRGGLNELRQKFDGKLSDTTNIVSYVEHLSLISQPVFHHPLFTLVLYNLFVRQQMLRMASLRLRGKHTISNLVNGLNANDVAEAIQARQQGLQSGSNVSRGFLYSVDAITRCLPHTNEAAKRGRSDVEALQHHMGLPTHFITATFDDDNSWLMQVYAGVTIDDNTPIVGLCDEELQKRAKRRTELRLQYPGISAFYFEMMLDIIFREVIGWDRKKHCKTETNGLLGECKAAFVCIEEQGRKTLHMHFTVWVEKIQHIQANLQHPNNRVRMLGATGVEHEFDRIATTKLFPTSRSTTLASTFQHDGCDSCSVSQRPEVVEDQKLRQLRHKSGYSNMGGIFATCKLCTKSWTYEQLTEAFLLKSGKLGSLSLFPHRSVRRLEAMCIEYQKKPCNLALLDPVIINACYNSHRSSHCTSCFRSNKCTGKRKRSSDDECRYHFPDKQRLRTGVHNTDERTMPWFLWDGTETKHILYDIRPKRNTYDLFQNVSCYAISESKMTCNSNVSLVIPGPVSQYITKYQTKGTQHDDTEEFTRVAEAIQKMLSPENVINESCVSERSEAFRLLLRASFAHNKTNVVGAPMASFLTRFGSRFISTHEFVWCPLRDICAILLGERVNLNLQQYGNITFFENNALHYLCRPEELEAVSVFDFFSKFGVVSLTARNKESIMPFCNTEFYQHPSYDARLNQMQQGVRSRKQEVLIKVSQFDFPDTAEFRGSIFSADTPTNPAMEKYARLVMVLFYPLRQHSELLLDHSYRNRLCAFHSTGQPLPKKATDFLQNIQNTRSNCLRCPSLPDELERHTECYQYGIDEDASEWNINEEHLVDEEDMSYFQRVDDIFSLLDVNQDITNAASTTHSVTGAPNSMCFKRIQNKGSAECGRKHIATTKVVERHDADPFIKLQQERQTERNLPLGEMNDNRSHETSETKTRRDIFLVFSKRDVRVRQFSATDQLAASVMEANGSCASIFSWANAAKLDVHQKVAFEMIAVSFVLTFYEQASITEPDTDMAVNREFRTELARLNKMMHGRICNSSSNDKLVCFMHGAGGSGKSTVIDLVLAYSKEYCEHLNHRFNCRTIVVCAMSGVAATLIMGETAHSALLLNQGKEITSEQADAWKDTRLVIVDEISFASAQTIEKMDQNLRELTQRKFEQFGGLNVVFSGDFRQLDPVKAIPIYLSDCPQFQQWVNCYVELQGNHRFRDDPKWGNLLRRFRDGNPSLEDIKMINKQCHVRDCSILPEGITYACYRNRDRDAINTATFLEHCEQSARASQSETASDAILILSDKLETKKSAKIYEPLSRNASSQFWTNCGEDDVKFKNSTIRMDPVLKLYCNCPMMLTHNDDVKNGKANGSRATLDRVVLKTGEIPVTTKLSNGTCVAAVFAGQVSHLELSHSNNRIVPSTFSLEPKPYTFEARFPVPESLSINDKEFEMVKMKARQFPLISNTATTGHKLQGATMNKLFVHEWHYNKTGQYASNWPYVVLSRVRSLDGLYIRDKLEEDPTLYAMPPKLESMLRNFRKRCEIEPLTDEEMNDLLRGNSHRAW
jgi:hypothetical protein